MYLFISFKAFRQLLRAWLPGPTGALLLEPALGHFRPQAPNLPTLDKKTPWLAVRDHCQGVQTHIYSSSNFNLPL